MTLEEIKELIRIVKDSGVAELEVQRGDNRVWIKWAVGAVHQEVVLTPVTPAPPAAAGPAAGHPIPEAPAAPAVAAPPDPLSDPSLHLVKAPIVGTFYEAPAPGADPFVKVGDTVHPGQVLCIIESMKLMNEIEAETAGVIVHKLVPNAKPVEYGEALFAIRPL